MKRVSLAVLLSILAQAVLAQQGQPQAPRSDPKLEQMVAGGASSKELADYVFDTHGCKTCHTIGKDGKLGYTAKGKERAQGFEGCVNMLTGMTVVVQLPEDKRSPQQREKAARFAEFGCTACHKLAPGKLALTDVGARLADLHLGCVDVEKLVSNRSGAQK